MGDEARLRIDGVEYEFPAFNSLTMGEWREVKQQYGLTPDELVEGLRELQDGRLDPACLLALIYVAIRRARGDASPKDVTRRLDQFKVDEVIELYAELNRQAEGEADPTQSTTGDGPAPSTVTSVDSSEPYPENGSPPDIGHLASGISAG